MKTQILLCIFLIFQVRLACQSTSVLSGEQLMNATAKMTVIKDTSIVTGTGFFFYHNKEEFFVTNKHVITNARSITCRMNYTLDSLHLPDYGDYTIVNIPSSIEEWIVSNDTTIDLAAISVDKLTFLQSKSKANGVYHATVGDSMIPHDTIWNNIDLLEEVVMLGFPKGLMDNVNNTAIARTGSIASLPKLNYDNRMEFLIDIPAYNGSSGSPIFLRRQNFGFTPSDGNGVSIGISTNLYFIGILYGGPMYDKFSDEMKVVSISELSFFGKDESSKVPINIGAVIKSTELIKLLDSAR